MPPTIFLFNTNKLKTFRVKPAIIPTRHLDFHYSHPEEWHIKQTKHPAHMQGLSAKISVYPDKCSLVLTTPQQRRELTTVAFLFS